MMKQENECDYLNNNNKSKKAFLQVTLCDMTLSFKLSKFNPILSIRNSSNDNRLSISLKQV